MPRRTRHGRPEFFEICEKESLAFADRSTERTDQILPGIRLRRTGHKVRCRLQILVREKQAARTVKLVRSRFRRYLNQDRAAKIVFSAPGVGLQRGFLHCIGNRRENDVAVLHRAGDIHTVNHDHITGVAASVGADLRSLGSEVVGQTAGSFSGQACTYANYAGRDGQDIPQIPIRRRQISNGIG